MKNINFNSIPEIILSQCSIYQNKTVLKYKKDNKYIDISWKELNTFIVKTSYFLQNKLKLSKDSKVALLSENRPEWLIVDVSTQAVQLVNIPLYPNSTPLQIKTILEQSESKVIFVSKYSQLEKILAIWGDLKKLEKVVCFNNIDLNGLVDLTDKEKNKILFFHQELSLIDEDRKWEEDFQKTYKSIKLEDTATIIYTSGTSAEPKGVVLTHKNIISNCIGIRSVVRIDSKDLFLSFLPLSHIFERTAGQFLPLISGATIAYAESVNKLISNIEETNPTVAAIVPRIFEKAYEKILDNIYRGGLFSRVLFNFALDVCKKYDEDPKKLKNTIFKFLVNQLIMKKIRRKFGKKLRFFVSGGASLPPHIAKFFLNTGILILEGYGLTESSPVISVNLEKSYKIGSIGKPLPNLEVKIVNDEILAKGPSIMSGYYKNEKATKETLENGWLKTGDIGYIDEDGFLHIKGRRKDVIVIRSGKNIYPELIEKKLTEKVFIEQACIVGDDKNYITALIVPSFSAITSYAETHHLDYLNVEDLIENERIRELIARNVGSVNKELAIFEKIKKYKILSKEFSQERDELTLTLKLKRRVIYENYKEEIEELYIK